MPKDTKSASAKHAPKKPKLKASTTKKRSDDDAKLAEALFAHASETGGSMRAMVKGLQQFGAAPAMAVLSGLVSLVKSRGGSDSISASKVFRAYETVRVRLKDLHEDAVAAEKASDDEKLKEIEAAAARYASTHASCAAIQAWRAVGGQSKHESIVRNKIIQSLGSLSAD